MRLRREVEGWSRPDVVIKLQLICPHAQSVDQWVIRDWEMREVFPRDFWPSLCQVFGAQDIAELGLGNGWSATAYWTLATDAERKAEVKRRKMLKAGFFAGGTALLPRGTAALEPVRLDSAWLDHVDVITTSLARLYDATPPGTLLGPVRSHVSTLVAHLNSPGLPADRLRLHRAIADAASFAGRLEFQLDRTEPAAGCLGLAEHHAREAGDDALRAQILVSKSILHSTTPTGGLRGDSAAALALLEQAEHLMPEHAPGRVRSRLFARLAEELAASGDPDGCYRALDQAAAALDQPEETGGTGFFSDEGYYSDWDGTRLDGFRGICSVLLGEEKAVDMLSRTLEQTTKGLRNVLVMTDLAAAYAQTGAPELAARELISAHDLASRTGFRMGIQRIHGVRATTPRSWSDLPCMRELDERLRAA